MTMKGTLLLISKLELFRWYRIFMRLRSRMTAVVPNGSFFVILEKAFNDSTAVTTNLLRLNQIISEWYAINLYNYFQQSLNKASNRYHCGTQIDWSLV